MSRQTLVLDCPADLSSAPLVLRPRDRDPYCLHAVHVAVSAAVSNEEVRLRIKNGAGDTLAIFAVTSSQYSTSFTFAAISYDGQPFSTHGEIPVRLILTPEMELSLESTHSGIVFTGKCVVTFGSIEG